MNISHLDADDQIGDALAFAEAKYPLELIDRYAAIYGGFSVIEPAGRDVKAALHCWGDRREVSCVGVYDVTPSFDRGMGAACTALVPTCFSHIDTEKEK